MPQPRDWCQPREAFGDPHAEERVWLPPANASRMDEFRAAVVQHAIAISVRRYKNEHGITQDELGRRDDRPDAANRWNRRLNGRAGLTMKDFAVLVQVLPGALPLEGEIRMLLGVAEKAASAAPGWGEVDS